MVRSLIAALAALFVTSCGLTDSPEEMCQYSNGIRVNMEIVDVTARENSEVYDVWLQFDKSIYAQEQQSLGELRNEPVTTEFLELNPFLHEGTTLTGYVYEVEEGNCKTPPPNFDQGFDSPR